jgi:L-glyceraldehyde 3-phosphate reductase
VVGASSVSQLDDSIGALENLDFTRDELDRIDQHAVEAGINLWARSSQH